MVTAQLTPAAQATAHQPVIINMGAEYNVMNEAVPGAGEVKLAGMFGELLGDAANADALFAVQIRVFWRGVGDASFADGAREELARLTDLGFDLAVYDDVLCGLIPGARLKDFPVNKSFGYEIRWDTSAEGVLND